MSGQLRCRNFTSLHHILCCVTNLPVFNRLITNPPPRRNDFQLLMQHLRRFQQHAAGPVQEIDRVVDAISEKIKLHKRESLIKMEYTLLNHLKDEENLDDPRLTTTVYISNHCKSCNQFTHSNYNISKIKVDCSKKNKISVAEEARQEFKVKSTKCKTCSNEMVVSVSAKFPRILIVILTAGKYSFTVNDLDLTSFAPQAQGLFRHVGTVVEQDKGEMWSQIQCFQSHLWKTYSNALDYLPPIKTSYCTSAVLFFLRE